MTVSRVVFRGRDFIICGFKILKRLELILFYLFFLSLKNECFLRNL